jgi:hypothetical protein
VDTDDDIRLAFGDAAKGTTGFRLTHQQAVAAQAVALAAGSPAPRAVAFSQVAPVAMMLASKELLRPWVLATLAGLATDDEHHARLRDTLLVFLQTGGSYKATAERLTLHKNTVQYRIRKAEDSLGRPVSENGHDVELALQAGNWLGSAVLQQPRSAASDGAAPADDSHVDGPIPVCLIRGPGPRAPTGPAGRPCRAGVLVRSGAAVVSCGVAVRRRARTLGRIVVTLARRGRVVLLDAPFVQAALAVAALVDGGPVQGVLADHVVDGRAEVSELLLQALALDSLVLIGIVTGADDRASDAGDLRGVGGEPGHARPGVAADAVRNRPVAGHQLAPFARTGGAVEVPVA